MPIEGATIEAPAKVDSTIPPAKMDETAFTSTTSGESSGDISTWQERQEQYELQERQRTVEDKKRLTPYVDITEAQLRSLLTSDYLQFVKTVSEIETKQATVVGLRHIDVIADRFLDAKQLLANTDQQNQQDAEELLVHSTQVMQKVSRDASNLIEPEILDKFLTFIDQQDPLIEYYALHAAAYLPEENPGSYYDKQDNMWYSHPRKVPALLWRKFNEDLIQPKYGKPPLIDLVQDNFHDYIQSSGFTLNDYITHVYETADISQLDRITQALGQFTTAETIIAALREGSINNPRLKQRFDQLQKHFIPEQATAYLQLEKLYEDINFKDYKPNQEVNEYEIDLLLKNLPPDGKVLVFGCGPGREVAGLTQYGRDVDGFDLVEEHVRQAEETYPELKGRVKRGSWPDNIPFERGTYKAVVLFGRGFLHNTSIEDGRSCLYAMSDMLSDDSDAAAFVDLPDLYKGHYEKEQNRFAQAAGKLGLWNYHEGSIWDSPDGKSYFTRLVPASQQFIGMARLSGLKAEQIATRTFHNEDGTENVNTYWKLTRHTFSDYEISEAFDMIDEEF